METKFFLDVKPGEATNTSSRILVRDDSDPIFDGYKYYKRYLNVSGRTVIYYIQMYDASLFFPNDWVVYIQVGTMTDFIVKLEQGLKYYTPESIKEALHGYPVLCEYLCNRTYKGYSITMDSCVHEAIMIRFLNQYELTESEANAAARSLVELYEALVKEIKHFRIDTKQLIKKSNSSNQANKTLTRILIVAGVVALRFGIKAVVQSFGGDIDFDDADCGDSGDFEIDGLNADTQYGYESWGMYNVSFGSSEQSYIEKKLDNAYDNIDYYTDELKRTNISDVYRRNCQFKLDQAIKAAEEWAKKLDKLIAESK